MSDWERDTGVPWMLNAGLEGTIPYPQIPDQFPEVDRTSVDADTWHVTYDIGDFPLFGPVAGHAPVFFGFPVVSID